MIFNDSGGLSPFFKVTGMAVTSCPLDVFFNYLFVYFSIHMIFSTFKPIYIKTLNVCMWNDFNMGDKITTTTLTVTKTKTKTKRERKRVE